MPWTEERPTLTLKPKAKPARSTTSERVRPSGSRTDGAMPAKPAAKPLAEAEHTVRVDTKVREGNRTRSQARRVLSQLFELFMAEPEVMPPEWGEPAMTPNKTQRARAVCDYIAGMTDRYAIEVHRKLFSLDLDLDL